MNTIEKQIEFLTYINKVIDNNQSVTVLDKDNKRGKDLAKMLKKNFKGGIDGWSSGAEFVGILPLGQFSVNLNVKDNKTTYVSYSLGDNGKGCHVPLFIMKEFLQGLGAIK